MAPVQYIKIKWHLAVWNDWPHDIRRGFVCSFFDPKMHPRAFLNCFVLDALSSNANNVLGHILGLIFYLQNQS